MALRKIRLQGDAMLSKSCRPITEMGNKIKTLIDDMFETMYAANGVGLAGPQVGILKRVVVIDIGDGPLCMINPEIIESSGVQVGDEGCLSLPGKAGQVTRPNHIKAHYYDRNMKECVIEADELLARAICHEVDHLEGHMYTEFVEGDLHDVSYDDEE